MSVTFAPRGVARIESPEIERGMSDAHRVRPLIRPGDWAATDPFLLLMEDWFPEGVFDDHPHRGIETVTYVLEGTIEHYDNHAHTGTIRAGDAQWMTAGRGLIHNERPARGQTVHALQLWVNLPRAQKLVPARHQHLPGDAVPVRREPGAEIRVFSGSSGGVTSPTRNYTLVTMVEMRLEPHARVDHEVPAGFNAFVVVLDGRGAVGPSATPVRHGQLAWLTRSEAPGIVPLATGEEAMRALLFGGGPLGEPVAARGPFVMNTDEELREGFAEFRRQGERFGLEA